MKQLVLVGYPLGHSLSPVMHNAALNEMGLDSSYRYDIQPTRAHELQTCVQSIREGSLEGANVTTPYKTDIMNYLEEVSEEATAVGSVNTLYRSEDRVAGCNTDVSGFLESLKEYGVSLKGRHATILGAGGAARAIGYALVNDEVAGLNVLNRSLARAEELVRNLNTQGTCDVHVGPTNTAEFDFNETDLLVNCTPIGMVGHSVTETPLGSKNLHSDMVVVDLVYNPRRTKLLQEAERVGCLIIDGIGMLVHQGAEALELWVGKKPPIEVMRSAVIQALGG
ncbi:MAG: shikimate dehydrogenase [Candidatus Thorarchaeota archaeon]|nr:shikimate dehydrogenase [Candidatus Thorarchaeota archaeon]